jgi:hypothetical protein
MSSYAREVRRTDFADDPLKGKVRVVNDSPIVDRVIDLCGLVLASKCQA